MRCSRFAIPMRVALVLACLLAVFALAACSLSDGDDASPHVDNGKLRIYYEEPYAVVPEGGFYHERGFATFLDAYNALFSLSEVTYLEPTFLAWG